MNRRDFLKSAAAVGVASGASVESGCAVVGSLVPSDANAIDMEQYLRTVDDGLSTIGRTSMFAEGQLEAPELSAADRERLRQGDDLGRKCMRTAFLVGMFGDLPEDLQADPGMQERLLRHLPEVDEALERTETFLSNLEPADFERIRVTLARNPELVMHSAETIGGGAAGVGVSLKRRLQFRAMMTEISGRLRAQPPELLIGGLLDKVARLRARHDPDPELRRELAARVQACSSNEGAATPEPPQATPRSKGTKQGRGRSAGQIQQGGDKDYTFALVMLGLGATLGILGFAIGAASGTVGLLFVGTLGVIFVLVGLIAAIAVAAS